MTNDRNDYEPDDVHADQVWPAAVRWDLGEARGYAGEFVWRCDALRAGRLYSRSLFGTQAEAESFATRMRQTEPDHLFSVEAIQASTMWN